MTNKPKHDDIIIAAHERLTDYMLNVFRTESDGLVHRNGMIAAVMNIDRDIVENAVKSND